MTEPSMMTPRERDEWEQQQARREQERRDEREAAERDARRLTYNWNGDPIRYSGHGLNG